NENEISQMVESIDEPAIDYFIYCAGYYSCRSLQNDRVDNLDRAYRINMRAPYLLVQQLLPKMTAAGVMAFLNSSAATGSGKKNLIDYSSTKSGLKTMVDCIRQEVNNKVNVVNFYLGKVATSMQQQACRQQGLAYKPERMI